MDIESSSALRINISISQPPSPTHSEPKPLSGKAPNNPETLRINKRLKQLMRKEHQRLTVHPPPPVSMSPEQRQMMIQKLPQAKELLSRFNTTMRVSFKVDDNEDRIRRIIIKLTLLYQQFRTDRHNLMDAPPVDHFTMTVEELEYNIKILKGYFNWVLAQVNSSDKGEPQHEKMQSVHLKGQAPAQIAVNPHARANPETRMKTNVGFEIPSQPKPAVRLQLPKHSLGAHSDSECFTIFPQESINNADKILFTRKLKMVRGTSLVSPMRDVHGGIWAWTAYLTPGARLEISKYPNVMGMVLDDES